MEIENPHSGEAIPWHPAFREALQLELQDYEGALEFIPEYPLTSEPLRIDCVVIKKAKDVVIKKNIAVIFRECNLLEYKSPGDYVSIADFYKIYAYACLYASFNNIPITSLTVSFVESHYPQKLLDHLINDRKYTVAETGAGIYTVSGDILPIQVIDSRKLPEEENLWLKNLSDELEPATINRIGAEANRQGKAARIRAYLYAIMEANYMVVKDVVKENSKIAQLMEELGITARVEARCRNEARAEARAEASAEVRAEVARNALAQGASPEFVQKITGLDIQTINSLTK